MAGTNIDGFRLYKKTDEGDEFIAEITKTARSKEFMRTMATGMYGISAYKIVADVIDPSKKTMLESIKRYFTVNPFYRIIIKDTVIESETVTVKWGNETNVNYFDGYQIFRINKVGDEVTYDLVDTIESDEVSEYVFMRDDDTTYNYVISPKTYDGYHDADSSYVEVLFVVIPPVTLLDPIDAVTYTARWKYEGDDEPDPEETNYLKIRFSQSTTEPTSITELGTWSRIENSEYNDWDLTFNNCQQLSYDEQFELLKNGFPPDDNIIWNRTSEDTVQVTIKPSSFIYNMINDDVINSFYGNILVPDAVCSLTIDDENNKIMSVKFGNEPIYTVVFIKSLDNLDDNFIILDGKINNSITIADTTRLTSIEKLTTNSFTDMSYMFGGCTSLTSVPLFDTSNVTDMDLMFKGCTSLTIVPLFDTSNVINMNNMFRQCTSLSSVPQFNTFSVTRMSGMFDECSSLTTVPLFDTSNVTDMNFMFLACTSLTTVPLFNTSNVTSMSQMFKGCTKVESGALALYQQASATGKVESYDGAFADCGKDTTTGLAELQQIPPSWGGLKVELPANTLRFRFSQSTTIPTNIENGGTWTKVTDSDSNDWDWTCNDTSWAGKFAGRLTTSVDPDIQLIDAGDTSNVTNMPGLFATCSSLTAVSLFDTSNVTNMDSMFAACKSLTTVPLFDTSKVTDMYQMFCDCTSLTTVPLFNTSNVTSTYGMGNMFSGCTSLTTVPLFNTSNVTNMGNMFYGCTKVESGAFALYQQASATGKVTSHNATFINCGKDTETGLAELQQIPQSWGGLGA